jgi:hypothetical protein
MFARLSQGISKLGRGSNCRSTGFSKGFPCNSTPSCAGDKVAYSPRVENIQYHVVLLLFAFVTPTPVRHLSGFLLATIVFCHLFSPRVTFVFHLRYTTRQCNIASSPETRATSLRIQNSCCRFTYLLPFRLNADPSVGSDPRSWKRWKKITKLSSVVIESLLGSSNVMNQMGCLKLPLLLVGLMQGAHYCAHCV